MPSISPPDKETMPFHESWCPHFDGLKCKCPASAPPVSLVDRLTRAADALDGDGADHLGDAVREAIAALSETQRQLDDRHRWQHEADLRAEASESYARTQNEALRAARQVIRRIEWPAVVEQIEAALAKNPAVQGTSGEVKRDDAREAVHQVAETEASRPLLSPAVGTESPGWMRCATCGAGSTCFNCRDSKRRGFVTGTAP